MKTFILINGKQAYIKKFKTKDDAETYVINYLDHSLYVGLFEVDNITLMKEYFDLI